MNGAQLTIEVDGGCVAAVIHGEVDISNADALADDLTEAMSGGMFRLVLDLSEVGYLDSAGIRAMFEVARRLELSRQSVALVVPPTSPLRRLFAITRVEDVMPVVSCRAEAGINTDPGTAGLDESVSG